jgi:uncharacterized protein
MSLRPVVLGFIISTIFWFVMFSPWTAGLVDFWTTMALAWMVPMAWSLFYDRKELRRLYAFQAKWIVIGLAAAAVLYLCFFVGDRISTFLFEFSKSQIASIYSTKSQASPLMIGAILLLLGPAEEIFWRGFAQRRMQERFGTMRGFLVTTAIYALVHIWAFNLMLLMAALICGLFWGWMYVKYRSIWPGLISHAVWDLLVYLILPIQ